MRVLWVTNIMLPAYARAKKMKSSVREGWLSGLYESLIAQHADAREDALTLAVAFPVAKRARKEVIDGTVFYPFREDVASPERYDRDLEKRFEEIFEEYRPDVLHVFGTEFPHTLAAVRAFGKPDRTLIGLQGICTECARQYRADLPDKVWNRTTFRDALRHDSLKAQQEKMQVRGVRERGALLLTEHVSGRTAFDREFTRRLCPRAVYHPLNETMRPAFYEGLWSIGRVRRHSIFIAQGDYPLKGFHFMLRALPYLLRQYPDLHISVAGNPVFDLPGGAEKKEERKRLRKGLKKKAPQDLRIGAYGEYLRQLIVNGGWENHVSVLGELDGEQMKETLLQTHLFVCPSMLENSPNSVAEAMLLGVPVVAAAVGGIPSMIDDECEGLLFKQASVRELAMQIARLFADDELCVRLGEAARIRARIAHDPGTNVARLLAIYREIDDAALQTVEAV